jgi:hypothetical protein
VEKGGIKMDRDLIAEYIRGAFLYATETLKSLVLLSALSYVLLLAATLCFFDNGMFVIAKKLMLPACVFFGAAILAIASFGLSYLSQMLFIQYLGLGVSKIGVIFQCIAILTTFSAFGICIWAMFLTFKVIVVI